MGDFRDLLVWQRSHQLTLMVYKATKCFPREELFGITSQLRRAMSSVPANIAEGNGRTSRKEYLQFLSVARGSLHEARYFITLAADLAYLTTPQRDELDTQLAEVTRLLAGLIRSLQRTDPRST